MINFLRNSKHTQTEPEGARAKHNLLTAPTHYSGLRTGPWEVRVHPASLPNASLTSRASPTEAFGDAPLPLRHCLSFPQRHLTASSEHPGSVVERCPAATVSLRPANASERPPHGSPSGAPTPPRCPRTTRVHRAGSVSERSRAARGKR